MSLHSSQVGFITTCRLPLTRPLKVEWRTLSSANDYENDKLSDKLKTIRQWLIYN